MGRLKVNIKIGELVLHGVDKANAVHIGKAIESELAKLVQNDGLRGKMHNMELRSIDAIPVVTIIQTQASSMFGASIARSIYDTMGGSK